MSRFRPGDCASFEKPRKSETGQATKQREAMVDAIREKTLVRKAGLEPASLLGASS